MSAGNREQNIRRVIEMEDRICQCKRCTSLNQCLRKPSMGKGELEPEILIVFEYDSRFTRDINRVINLRNLIRSGLKKEKLYHTFLVRCQPKACAVRHGVSCSGEGKLLDKDNRCVLNGKHCEGIPIKPSIDEIISCLPFLLEELEILRPQTILLFGERTADFVLKSYGVFDTTIAVGNSYEIDGMVFLVCSDEEIFTLEQCRHLV